MWLCLIAVPQGDWINQFDQSPPPPPVVERVPTSPHWLSPCSGGEEGGGGGGGGGGGYNERFCVVDNSVNTLSNCV